MTTLPNPNDFPAVVVPGQEYEFYAELQQAEEKPEERMRNYTGQRVKVLLQWVKEDPDNDDGPDLYEVQASDGRIFTATLEELNGWDKALGQYFWPDGTYGPNRDTTYLTNER